MNAIVERILLLVIGIAFVGVITNIGADIINQGKQNITTNQFTKGSIPIDIMVRETCSDLASRLHLDPTDTGGSLVVWVPKNTEAVRIMCGHAYVDTDLSVLNSSSTLELTTANGGLTSQTHMSNIYASNLGTRIRLDVSVKDGGADCKINGYSVPDGYKVADLSTGKYFKLSKRGYSKSIAEIGEYADFP